MGTINQTAPISDIVAFADSGDYFNQLESAGSTAPIVWTTDVATTAFIVSPNGNLATSVTLPTGSYKASGTMVDAHANTGVWSFTLTVLPVVETPQTTVIPFTPLSPTGIEVMVPFQINPATGQVAIVQNYQNIIAQHVLSILMTAARQRVMLPTYGVGMENYVFQPDTPLIGAQIQASVQQAFKTWEPAVQILNVNVVRDPNNVGLMNVTVQYSTPYAATQAITVSLGGAIPTAPITTIATFSP